MILDYALSISVDGLRLLARDADSWTLLGEVSLESPDLSAELDALRREAGLEPGQPVRIDLPEDQIKFMTISPLPEDSEGLRDLIRTATPYDLADLSYDVAQEGDLVFLAIVALETLDEADTFASHYGFHAAAYSAQVPPALFPRKPIFASGDQPDLAAFFAPAPQEALPQDAPLQEALPEETLPETPLALEEPERDARPALQEPELTDAQPQEPPLRLEAPLEPSPAPEEPIFSARPRLADAPPLELGTPAPSLRLDLGQESALPASAAPKLELEEVAQDVAPVGNEALEPAPVPPEPVSPAPLLAAPSAAAPLAAPVRPVPVHPVPVRPVLASEPRQQLIKTSPKAASLFARKEQAPKTEPSIFARETAPALSATRSGIEAPHLRGPQLTRAAAPAPALPNDGLAAFAAQMPTAETAPFVNEEGPHAPAPRPRYTALILTLILLLFMLAVAIFSPSGKVVGAWLGAAPGASQITQESGGAQSPSLPSDDAPPSASTDLALAPPPSAQSAASAAVAAAIAALPATAPQPADLPSSDAAPAQDLLAEDTSGAALTQEPPLAKGVLVAQEDAEAFYQSTGVWTRASRPTLKDAPSAPTPVALPALTIEEIGTPSVPQILAEAQLPPQAPPPAAGERLPRDPRGFVLATPEGTRMPDGLMIYQGRPDPLPPSRPQTQQSAAAPEAAPTAAAGTLMFAATAPQLRPLIEVGEPAATIVAYDGLRPRPRPQDLPRPSEAAGLSPAPEAAQEESQSSFAGLRPQARPQDLSLPELPNVDVSETLNALMAEPSAPSAPARPAARPGNFDQVVAQQTARSEAAEAEARAAEAQRDEERETARQGAQRAAAVEQAAAQILANMPVPPAAVRETSTREEEDETDEIVVPASPTGRVPQSVAQNATQANAINLRDINLIGVFGRANDRRAIVRLSNGRMETVRVGDRLDGGQVTAISENVINYVKRGRTVALRVGG